MLIYGERGKPGYKSLLVVYSASRRFSPLTITQFWFLVVSCDLVYKSQWIFAKSCALLIIEEAANKTKSQQLNSKFGF